MASDFYERAIQARQQWIESQIGPDPRKVYSPIREGTIGATPYEELWPEEQAMLDAWNAKADTLFQQWIPYLEATDPAYAAKVKESFANHSASLDRINKITKGAALGVIGAAAGGAALTGAGVIGGGTGAAGGGTAGTGSAAAGTAATGAATDAAVAATLPAFDTGVGGLFGSQTAIDSALASGATGLGSTAGVGGGALLGSGGIAAPALTAGLGSGVLTDIGGAAADAAGSAAGAGREAGSTPGVVDALKQAGSTIDWGNALLTAGGLGTVVAAMLSDPESVGKGDPTLIAAQLRSLGYQEDAVKSIVEIATQQRDANARLMPLQEQALRQALDAGRTAYEQSQQDRAYAVERRGQLTGLQDKMIADANQFDTPAEEARRANAAMAGVGKSYADVNAANDRELAAMGVMPGSGRQMALREANAANQSRLAVSAANDARLAARNEGRSLVDRAAGALAGYPAAATNSTLLGANLGAGQVNTANAGAAGINSGYNAQTGAQQAAAGVAGQLGSNATGMYGVQTSRDLASTAAKNASNENLWAGAGTLLGGLSKWYQTANKG